jgi:3-dehydroquinate synthase
MERVSVSLDERSYSVFIGKDLLKNRKLFLQSLATKKVFIVSNKTVADIYYSQLVTSLEGCEIDTILLPDGEQYKTLTQWQSILDAMFSSGQRRESAVIALGGGVVGDMAGFAAACFHRGVPYVQVPTTLLAQVDASVGGKTAINTIQAKNSIGAFHQPSAVIIDVSTLLSLPDREYCSGLAEVVKVALILDSVFYAWLCEHVTQIRARDEVVLIQLIKRCCELKADIVAQDETDKGIRAILNFGHSFGHAIEAATEYKPYLHGEAVAIGMMMALRLSVHLGEIPQGIVDNVERLFVKFSLPIALNKSISASVLMSYLVRDKKNHSGKIRLILLERIGIAKVRDDVGESVLLDFLKNSE